MISNRQRQKKKAFDWMAKFIKLRDAIEDSIDKSYILVRCRTCGKVLQRGTKNCQAGHFIGRGMGGSSGVYFDERNVHVQCGEPCNLFKQGCPEYEEFMLEKYGPEVVKELRHLHKAKIYTIKEIVGLGIYYKQRFQELTKRISESANL